MFIVFFFHLIQQGIAANLTGDFPHTRENLNSRRMPRQCHWYLWSRQAQRRWRRIRPKLDWASVVCIEFSKFCWLNFFFYIRGRLSPASVLYSRSIWQTLRQSQGCFFTAQFSWSPA